MKGINVTSEIGRLRRVCLHRPGEELLNLPPDELDRLLFDDIPFLEVAQEEHDAFAQTLRDQGVEVVYLEELVAQAFDANPQARQEFMDEYLAEATISGALLTHVVREWLDSITDNLEFVRKTMAGISKSEVDMPMRLSIRSHSTLDELVSAHAEKQRHLIVDPMPNLYFTRDPFASIGTGYSLNRMYARTRRRETLYGKYIFKYHPDYCDCPQWYEREASFRIEGGDILNLSPTTLAVGISQRTEAAAIDALAANLFWNVPGSTIERIFAFDIPVSRAMMHLDTVFTQIDYDKFTIHPAIMGTLRVFEMTKGAEEGQVSIREHTDRLEHILAYALDIDYVKLIPCGGADPIAAAREQWNDGSNTLCVAPGTICVYRRNSVTNEILDKEGMNLLVIPSSELSRGRGGPRCMSMPLWRE